MDLGQPRVEHVDSHEIHIYDDILNIDDVVKYSHVLKHADFTFLHSSRKDTEHHREWAATFSVDDFESHPLHQLALEASRKIASVKELSCYDVFCSASSFGDMSFIHNDSSNNEDISTLYYANHKWESEWGGETLFYTDYDDARLAISCKPGRLVVFRGSLKHRAGVPNKICPEIRTTLSIRFQLKEEKHNKCYHEIISNGVTENQF